MSTSAKVILFGIISGLVWSIVGPGILMDSLFNSARETVLVMFTGSLTGVAVSMLIKGPLIRYGKTRAVILGLVSLPFGAFIYGVISSVFGLSGFDDNLGIIDNALGNGVTYAVLSVISLFGIIFLPLAVLTTFILRVVIRSNNKSGTIA